MKSSQELRRLLESIDRKSYPAYKSAQGVFDFGDYHLSIDHVQGDPFASPSKLSIFISHQKAGYPETLFDVPHKKRAFEDYLVRRFHKETAQYNFKAKGSGKSGLISISCPGPEILKRTACECSPQGIWIRLEAGFPANGRTINSSELIRILFDFLPRCVKQVLFYKNRPSREPEAVAELAEDQYFIRQELKRLGLVSFVADGAILPRESGISSRPMKNSVPFSSPESMRITLKLPHHGSCSGMAIRRGITLIVGGGYHGKSTLLKALEAGVYDHIAGDGREFVITDETALKLRAEDGRSIRNVDISMFINDLPNKKDTRCFSTEDASGSTSQAAGVIEGIESGSHVFLIDEDTSATNFMVRDDLMQKVISRSQEPITPFSCRAEDLFEKAGISTILVAGSSGAYFYIADTIIQMDSYVPQDITKKVREICAEYGGSFAEPAPGFVIPKAGRKLQSAAAQRNQIQKFKEGHRYSHGPRGREQAGREDRIKVKVYGKDSIEVGRHPVDLRFVEQLIDSEQTHALAQILRFCLEKQLLERYTVAETVAYIQKETAKGGLTAVSGCSYAAMGLCMPRPQEIFACINRFRG